MAECDKKEWFKDWFDTEFYHLLYKNRDQAEANEFISNLLSFIRLPLGSRVLDLACGKGRHSLFLSKQGLDVLGVDLSENSIKTAKATENEHLHFKVGDMRKPQGNGEFDAVFNLFTSFGYFETEQENLEALRAIHHSMKPGGWLVIDFMNSTKAVTNLQPHYRLERGGILFRIDKSIENHVISKKISFSQGGKEFRFEERVQALEFEDFEQYFAETGFETNKVFGDYRLSSFDARLSDRMILVARRKP